MMNSPKINTDALLSLHWNEQETKNAKIVAEFVQLLMNDHSFEKVMTRFGQGPYKQHNRNMADGISGVIETLRDFVKQAPEFSYEIKRMFVDGEQVIIHSHATLKAKHRGDDTKGMNIIDTWTVRDGKLIEHWDAIQALDVSMRLYNLFMGGKIKNSNGVF
ncbi:nuclear transport factor 2 family protein [Pseudoalteromonas sp. Of7M-16]|uniref:nuclear transport factor 2 family protein n=1 Tax=Pseudoalteromonas sp. Of7M-16 TaxID=2917756 RepID=UPI001EF63AD6|nr:nuclear transport factor 2 family protein [Pseudoalteromonas sp. Of7M-16]MCG7550213.1 nuclear transport factor 2 family protein [Pseudoalteromonas sp. Of7M-16]